MNQTRCLMWCAVLALSACSCLREDRGYIFNYSHGQPQGALRSQNMLFFQKELEKRSKGQIQVELYFSGVLGSERELMDLVATGALQGTRGGFYADANPKFNLISVPFLVDDWDQALRLVTSDFMGKINAGARVNGFHIPATGIAQGFRAHTNNIRPITHPEDLKGLKMRVPIQGVYLQTALAFGVNPQEIPYIEVYQALQTGVVDGQDNAPSNILDFKVYEVSKYLTITNYATGPDPFLVNLDWYDRLPNDLQKIFDEVANKTMDLSDKLNREKEQDFINKLTHHLEVNYVIGPSLQPFREAVKPVYQHFVDKGDFTWKDVELARKAARSYSSPTKATP
mgnify:CR=1 FL=1